jgi:hypothetical protein
MDDLHHRHPAFLLSCAFGALGVAFVLIGVITGVEPMYVVAIAAGSLSLGTALYWRSLLVSDWAARKPGRSR